MPDDSDRLLSVANSIAEGTSVSWDDEQLHAADEGSAATLRGLRDLEVILAAQRHIEREYDTTAKRNTVPDAGDAAPSRWRHLVILDKIGEGSFGTVYRAYDGQLAVDVALKLLSRARTARSKNPDRVLNEARLLARVRHPNVVTVYGADQTEDYVGLWMELIKGRTLGELLRTQGTFSAHETALIGRDLCRAVAAVHQAGILHGDIKAHNVMRQEGGRTVLMDFGAGRALIDDQAPRGIRNVIGTPMYLAPEVLDGKPLTTASDIYALGVLLYHLATGSYPVSSVSLTQIVQVHQTGERRRLRDVRPDLPDDFVRIVEQATAVDPARRFASAGAFEDALARMTSPIPTETGGSLRQTKRSLHAIPRWVMMLAAFGVLTAGATAVWLMRASNPTIRPTNVAETARPAASSSVDASPVTNAYEIDAAFYRMGRNGEEELTSGARVAPGDELFLKFQASVPINLYVVNEDEKGESFLEFPLAGQRQTNPIPAGQQVTLPGTATHWRVTTAGGREHFLVFASPDRLESFEQAFAALPSPQENAPVLSARLEPRTIERLRSVGGLTQDASKQNAGTGLSRLFTTPLTNARESARGLWVRQITLDNPAR